MNGILAKIAGWAQFGLNLVGQFSQNGAPHGWAQWLAVVGSGIVAIGVHASSNVGQVDPSHQISGAVKQ